LNWIRIFPSAADARERLPLNKPQLVVVNGTRVCLVRRENEWLAVSDKCTHNGESLSKGHVNYLGDIICPWHGYRFSMKTGQCYESAAGLPTYPVREDAEGVFIGL
jgi:nitrite reductase/ring-hydroxylating ferredoxin subunit